MSAASVGPVRSLGELGGEEVKRYEAVWVAMEKTIREDGSILERERVLAVAATSVHQLALNRGFYGSEVRVHLYERFVNSKAGSTMGIVGKILTQVVKGVLGWAVAQYNPVMGAVVSVIVDVATSDKCKEGVKACCKE